MLNSGPEHTHVLTHTHTHIHESSNSHLLLYYTGLMSEILSYVLGFEPTETADTLSCQVYSVNTWFLGLF